MFQTEITEADVLNALKNPDVYKDRIINIYILCDTAHHFPEYASQLFKKFLEKEVFDRLVLTPYRSFVFDQLKDSVKDFPQVTKQCVEPILKALKDVSVFKRMIDKADHVYELVQALPGYEKELKELIDSYILATDEQFKQMAEDADAVCKLAKVCEKFPGYGEKLVERILKDGVTFKQIVKSADDLCKLAQAFSKNNAQKLMKPMLSTAEEFDRMIQSASDARMVLNLCSLKSLSEDAELLKSVIWTDFADAEKFNQMVTTVSDVCQLVEVMPEHTKSLITHVFDNKVARQRIMTSFSDLRTIAKLWSENAGEPEYIEKVIKDIVKNQLEFNRIFASTKEGENFRVLLTEYVDVFKSEALNEVQEEFSSEDQEGYEEDSQDETQEEYLTVEVEVEAEVKADVEAEVEVEADVEAKVEIEAELEVLSLQGRNNAALLSQAYSKPIRNSDRDDEFNSTMERNSEFESDSGVPSYHG